MRKILLSLLFLASGYALLAQNNIMLHLAPRLGNAPFQLDEAVSAGSYQYKFTRLEYYISGISITHDGGQVTSMTDLYLLVRPAQDSMYDLGAHPDITNVEGITFSIGVDAAHNHDDPSAYPANHPLAPQNPEMQWGWAAGYRFAAIEGVAGSNFVNSFEVHALGDANYKTVVLSTAAEATSDGQTIHLIADYSKILTGINVSGGLIVHGSTGKAVTLLNNMKTMVFSAETSGTVDPAFTGSFTLSPNPASAGRAIASMVLPAGGDYRLTVTDLLGRVVQAVPLMDGSQQFTFQEGLLAGTYFIHLWQDGRPVVIEKLIIAQ